jgi:hypothetical protein
VGRPIAPRGASMLEVGKYGNEVAGAASGNCSDATASRQNFALPLWWPANSEFAIGTSSTWKTSHCLAGRHSSSAAWFRCHDSIRAALPAFVRQVDSWLPLGVSPRRRSPGLKRRQAIRWVDNPHRPIRATRRPSQDGPGKRLTQPMSKPAARTRSEFVTRHK